MFKQALYEQCARFLHIGINEFVLSATNRMTKEEPMYLHPTAGYFMSPRQVMIHVSEHMIKPHCGDDFFGIAAAQACLNQNSQLAVFSDGGFKKELEPIQDTYKHVVIIRLHKEGCTFENDSRSYCEDSPNTHDVYLVDGEIKQGLQDISNIVDPYLTEKVAEAIL